MNAKFKYILFSVIAFTLCAQGLAVVKQMEDLWGNPVSFDKHKLSVVSSVQSALCGYCLGDGHFVKANYGYYTRKLGGDYYLNSVCNTQRDLYAFAKHYGESDVPILTYPPELRTTYQNNGYPYLYALKKNKLIYRGIISPYASTFDSLKAVFWQDPTLPMRIGSPSYMSSRQIFENFRYQAVYVVPDQAAKAGITADYSSYTVKTISELTPDDLQKDLFFCQSAGREFQHLFEKFNLPLYLNKNLQWCIGGKRFAMDSVDVALSLPNPYNTGKYLKIINDGKLLTRRYPKPVNWLDFSIAAANQDTKNTELVLYGFFGKDGNQWSYCDSLTYGISRSRECVGQCPLPNIGYYKTRTPARLETSYSKEQTPPGFTIQGEDVRFPSIAAQDNAIYVAFEQKGDIFLVEYSDSCLKKTEPIELTAADSYDAHTVICGKDLWVFYLKQVQGFYHLYAKTRSMGLWSAEILISEYEPCDAVTPAVAAYNNEITTMWTVWQANSRYLYERKIINGRLQPTHLEKIVFKKDFDYTNAWYADLAYDREGKLWKAWNQHYPYSLCVVAACDTLPPRLASGDSPEYDNVFLGYPSIATGPEDQTWVFYSDETTTLHWNQTIQGSYFDGGSWVQGYEIAGKKETLYQTVEAVADNNRRLWVVWSERTRGGNWQLAYTRFGGDMWTEPVTITSGEVSSRAPKLAVVGDKVAVCYHALEKGSMSIRVVLIPN